MVVFGRHYHVVNVTSKTAEVQPFSPDDKALRKVPIVDKVTPYDNKCSGGTYALLFKNTLCVLVMDQNLVSPFLVREVGF